MWQGFYIGRQASYGSADMDFKNSGKDLLERLLNHIDLESQFNLSSGTSSNRNSGFGAFLGYNVQIEDAVFGVEPITSMVNSLVPRAAVRADRSATQPIIGRRRSYNRTPLCKSRILARFGFAGDDDLR